MQHPGWLSPSTTTSQPSSPTSIPRRSMHLSTHLSTLLGFLPTPQTLHSDNSASTPYLPCSSSTPQLRPSLHTPFPMFDPKNISPLLVMFNLQQQIVALHAKQDAVTTHTVLAQREATVYAYQLNSIKEKENPWHHIHTDAQILTLEEGQCEAKEEWTQTASAFSGSLKNKNKTACSDIVNALGITVTGVVTEIQSQIFQHFEANPELKTNAQYAGLFQTCGQKQMVPVDEIEQPPTQCCCLNDVTNTPAFPTTAPFATSSNLSLSLPSYMHPSFNASTSSYTNYQNYVPPLPIILQSVSLRFTTSSSLK
ncbi:hypothetical protein K435DRAFT_860890 [Dendrothele bispora CBS 962.96]|uniref:Uncharacterized protein n=1 Tax=Dendrothele bispora (strain CBS 962.96) TaxID=1314807 RepID=A0A4S8LWM9_DENBC|nr:hypothetical protein K435DRAFT_860890 [Dendrothele bispora CBS 962.96]